MQVNGINIGTQGVQGIQGATGILGMQGIQGVQGSSSVQGIQGIQGVSYFQGIHNAFPNQSGDVISYCLTSVATSTASIPVNRLVAIPFIPSRDTSYSSLSIYCSSSTAGALGRILIYSDSNGTPNTKLYESTDLSLSSTGRKIVTTSGTFLAGKTYWLAYYQNSSSVLQIIPTSITCAFLNVGYDSTYTTNCGYWISATFGSAPSTFGTGTLFTGISTNFAPMINITIA